MTTQQDQKARQLYELGYRPAAIADQLRVATCDVRRSLRRTRPNRPPPLTPGQQAARELAAEGYDRDAIRKVFGEGAL